MDSEEPSPELARRVVLPPRAREFQLTGCYDQVHAAKLGRGPPNRQLRLQRPHGDRRRPQQRRADGLRWLGETRTVQQRAYRMA